MPTAEELPAEMANVWSDLPSTSVAPGVVQGVGLGVVIDKQHAVLEQPVHKTIELINVLVGGDIPISSEMLHCRRAVEHIIAHIAQ